MKQKYLAELPLSWNNWPQQWVKEAASQQRLLHVNMVNSNLTTLDQRPLLPHESLQIIAHTEEAEQDGPEQIFFPHSHI